MDLLLTAFEKLEGVVVLVHLEAAEALGAEYWMWNWAY